MLKLLLILFHLPYQNQLTKILIILKIHSDMTTFTIQLKTDLKLNTLHAN